MKQIRKISNLIADELVNAGYDENDSLFESKVTEIVNMISEAVKEAPVEEEAEAEVVYMATSEWTLGGVDVLVGDFVEVDDIGEDGAEVTIYDEDGEVKAEEVTVPIEDIDAFADSAEVVEVEYDEEDDVEEASSVSYAGGKKHKVTAKQKQMKAKGKGKNFYMKRVNGKWTKIKITPEMRKAMKKNAKKNFKGAARKKAQKTLKKTRRANEGFDINVNGMSVSVEEGDILVFEGDTVTVIREGNVIVSGITVSESFLSRCVDEGVLEGSDCESGDKDEEDMEEEAKPADKKDAGAEEDVDEKANEGAVLTFKAGKGYVLVKEGSEYPMGNRVRARAMLTNEGYNISSKELDKAADGEVVIL